MLPCRSRILGVPGQARPQPVSIEIANGLAEDTTHGVEQVHRQSDAVGEAGWDVIRCVRHRVEADPDCSAGCYARIGCVIGPEHRYSDDELRHHQERALRTMREYYNTHLSK